MNRSQPATLFLRPVTADDLIYDLQNNTKSSEYSKHTRSDMITSTGHDRLLYNPDRSLPTTLYAFYPVGLSPSEYTENTRSCIMTSTGHDRLLYNPDRSLPTTLYVFTQWGQVLQNTLQIHGCVLWLLPVTTDYFICPYYRTRVFHTPF